MVNLQTKTPAFYDNAHLHICTICLRLDVSSLTEIQYLQIRVSKKGLHTNEIVMFEIFCPYWFVRWTIDWL